jgi:hypothetical protein
MRWGRASTWWRSGPATPGRGTIATAEVETQETPDQTSRYSITIYRKDFSDGTYRTHLPDMQDINTLNRCSCSCINGKQTTIHAHMHGTPLSLQQNHLGFGTPRCNSPRESTGPAGMPLEPLKSNAMRWYQRRDFNDRWLAPSQLSHDLHIGREPTSFQSTLFMALLIPSSLEIVLSLSFITIHY